MSATYAYDEQPAGGHPLAPGASPAAIRAALLPADQAGFDVAYGTALAASRVSLDPVSYTHLTLPTIYSV